MTKPRKINWIKETREGLITLAFWLSVIAAISGALYWAVS